MRWFAVGLLFALAACPSDEEVDVCATDPAMPPPEPTLDIATAKVGVGDYERVEISDGDDIEAHYGPQGGYHVYVSLRATGLYPGPPEEIARAFGDNGSGSNSSIELRMKNPMLTYTLTDTASGMILAEHELQQPLRPESDGTEVRIGDLLVFTNTTMAEQVNGKVVDYSVSIVDLCGRSVSDKLTALHVTAEGP